MPDPAEGVAPDGTIVTGARRDRVPVEFEPVLRHAVELASPTSGSLYLYGSIANGTATLRASDVDLLSIDLPDARDVAEVLTERFADTCRGVEVSALTAEDLAGDADAAHGNRVFLRHYCVHLSGPDPAAALPAFPADVRAARGFNGDLGHHLERWRATLQAQGDPAELGVRVARKTLLAVAGLVSVHDGTWTTDRSRAVARWGEVDPGLAGALRQMGQWVSGEAPPLPAEVTSILARGGAVEGVVDRFRTLIGLWAG